MTDLPNPKGLTHLMWFDMETDGLGVVQENGHTVRYKDPYVFELGVAILPFGELRMSHASYAHNWVFEADEVVLRSMDPYVLEMHTNNGLLKEVENSRRWPTNATDDILGVMRDLGIKRNECGMAGTGIAAFDVPLLRSKFAPVYNYLHYAPFDLGLARRMMTQMLGVPVPDSMPDSGDGHRALDDVRAALRQAEWLRNWAASQAWSQP